MKKKHLYIIQKLELAYEKLASYRIVARDINFSIRRSRLEHEQCVHTYNNIMQACRNSY